MAEQTTYDVITNQLDSISKQLKLADENNDFSKVVFLATQLKGIKEYLHRLLWVELPELNDSQKYAELSKHTEGMLFSPGIFEFDVMRQAFFKRQAKAFFDTEEERREYIAFTEEQYQSATVNLKDIYFNTKQTMPNASYKEKKAQVQSEFVEVMKC